MLVRESSARVWNARRGFAVGSWRDRHRAPPSFQRWNLAWEQIDVWQEALLCFRIFPLPVLDAQVGWGLCLQQAELHVGAARGRARGRTLDSSSLGCGTGLRGLGCRTRDRAAGCRMQAGRQAAVGATAETHLAIQDRGLPFPLARAELLLGFGANPSRAVWLQPPPMHVPLTTNLFSTKVKDVVGCGG